MVEDLQVHSGGTIRAAILLCSIEELSVSMRRYHLPFPAVMIWMWLTLSGRKRTAANFRTLTKLYRLHAAYGRDMELEEPLLSQNPRKS